MIHLIGSRQWNPNGTITLGYAEGGLKVTLVGGNWLDPTDIPDMNEMYFKTMHHEFAHILHQTKNYPTEYNSLSEGHYSPSGWNNRHNMADYAPFGFVTAYGSSEPGEDIAEVTACYLTWTPEQWAQLEAGAGDEGWSIIQQKITIVKKYMKDIVRQAHEQGYVTTIHGRKRFLPEIKSRNAALRGYAERNAINAPLQGSAADIIKIAMVAIDAEIRRRGLRSRMIIQVHDELVFNVYPPELAELQTMVTELMEHAYSGRVTLEVSSGTGENWLDAH